MFDKILNRIKSAGIPLLIIVVAVVIFIYFKSTKPSQPPVEVAQKVWPVQAMPITLGVYSKSITLLGQVASKALVKTSAPISAVVQKVWVQVGDEVKKGETLVALSADDLALPVQSAQSNVADYDSQLALEKLAYDANVKRLAYEKKVMAIKQKNVQRNKKLLKKNLASQSVLDKSNELAVRQQFVVVGAKLSVKEHALKLKQLQAHLQKAKVALAQAKLNQSRGVVIAPYDARVSKVSVVAGDRVAMGSPLVSFYALSSLELKAKVPVGQESLLAKSLQQGIALQAIYQSDSKKYLLPFNRLGGESSASGVDAYFTLPQSLKTMRPGDLMSVYLSGPPMKNTFIVPFSAVYGSNIIYLIKQGHLVKQTVQNLGQTLKNGQAWALLKADSASISSHSQVLITHLPNAITGLSVAKVKM